MINRELIGHKTPPMVLDVEPFQLRLFAKAIGETNPIYFDEKAAIAAGHRNILAPPTFTQCLSFGNTADPFASWGEMGIDIARVLHGEQKFEYTAPIYAGDTITMEATITDIYDKKEGAMEFMVTETLCTNQHGEVVVKMTSTLIQRH